MDQLSETQWINLFLRRLGNVEPSVEIAQAIRYAMRSYGDEPASDPDRAAEGYAAVMQSRGSIRNSSRAPVASEVAQGSAEQSQRR